MKRFSGLAKQWNREVFGNIFWKKSLLAMLGGIQRKTDVRPSRYLLGLESQLRTELENVLLQEESLGTEVEDYLVERR